MFEASDEPGMPAMEDPDVLAALDRIADADARAAARSALESMCWDVLELSDISQLGLQSFLWYDLGCRWAAPEDELREVPEAFARLFDELGMTRYARICRSSTTERMLTAWHTSSASSAHRAFVAALDRSGVTPPDTERLQWSSVLGLNESRAYDACAGELERAIVAGELRPGSARWRSDQRAIVDTWLDSGAGQLFAGATPRSVIERERLEQWLEARRGSGCAIPAAMRTSIVELFDTDQSEAPNAPSSAGAFAPFQLLVEQAAATEGLRLTETGRLGRAFVRETAGQLGWLDDRIGSVGGEHDVPMLRELRELAVELGLVRKRRLALVATPRGRSTLTARDEMQARVMHQLCVAGPSLERAVMQLVLAFLLLDGVHERGDLVGRAHRAMHDAGWRSSDLMEDDLSMDAVDWWVAERTRLLDVLELVRCGGSWPALTYELTDAGAAAARVGLRACAIGPAHDLRVMPS